MAKETDKIEIKKERKEILLGDIKAWFWDNREEDIGDLQAELLLDFLMERAGAEIYNQALNDALYWFKNRFNDLEIDYYSLEKRLLNEQGERRERDNR